jgi:hypothetical protein
MRLVTQLTNPVGKGFLVYREPGKQSSMPSYLVPYRGVRDRWTALRRQQALERSRTVPLADGNPHPKVSSSIEEELEFCFAAGKDARTLVKRKLDDVVKAFNVDRVITL